MSFLCNIRDSSWKRIPDLSTKIFFFIHISIIYVPSATSLPAIYSLALFHVKFWGTISVSSSRLFRRRRRLSDAAVDTQTRKASKPIREYFCNTFSGVVLLNTPLYTSCRMRHYITVCVRDTSTHIHMFIVYSYIVRGLNIFRWPQPIRPPNPLSLWSDFCEQRRRP